MTGLGQRGIRYLFATMAIWGAIAACSPPAQHGTVLNRGNEGEPKSLDPQFIDGTWEANIVGDMLVGLTTEDAAARPIPGAATDWSVSPDGKTWTFHIRKHLWSDGTPVTAGDFVFAWRRLLNPKSAVPYAYNMWVIKNAEAISAGRLPVTALGAKATDDRTLVVTLEHPAPYLPELLDHHTAYPLPRHAVEKFGNAWARPEHYVANGPYIVREWVPNDHITLVKNPRFYDAKHVRIDIVNFYPTSDAAAAVNRLRAGELDTQTPLPAQQIVWLRAHMPAALQMAPYLGVSYISINFRRKPLADIRIREALNLAYNRDAIVDKIMRLGEAPAYGLIPPGVAGYPARAAMAFRTEPYHERVKRAQALMKAAGFGPNHHLQLRYDISTDPDGKRAAAAMQAMMHAIYIDLEIVPSEIQVHFQKMAQHDFDLAAGSWIADFSDATNFLDLLRSNSGKNYGSYRNLAYDALLNRAQTEADPTTRGELLRSAEQTALNDYAWIPVRFLVTHDLVQPYVKGWVANSKDVNRTRWLWIDAKR